VTHQEVIKALDDKRSKLRKKLQGIGEPAIAVPSNTIKTANDGSVSISMEGLIVLVSKALKA
jgi:hypothetical protein